jgi:hypothetical protein
VNLEIGSVTPASFGTIDWSAGPYFVEVIVNGTAMGTSELLTVPYALYASNGVIANSVGTSEVVDNSLTADDLAPNSVGASEVINGSLTRFDLLDEPAVSQAFTSGSWFTLTDTYNDVVSISATAPADGYFLVTGTGTLALTKNAGLEAFWGVDLHTAPDVAPGVTPMAGSHSAARGYYQDTWGFSASMGVPFHLQEVFSVTQGTSYNYYLNIRAENFATAYAFHAMIVVLFIPSAL